MLEEILGSLWKLLKRSWAKRELRLHVVTWFVTAFMAFGLYTYIGFRITELVAHASEDQQIHAIEFRELKEGVSRVEGKVDQLVGYLIEEPNRRPAGRH